jgi:phosphate-selective porin OprO/OprP
LPTSTEPADTGLGSYKTSGQLTFFSYEAPSSDTTGAETTFAHERASHLDPQLYYYVGPFGLLAEWVWSRQGVQRGNSTAVLTNQAAHATASFVVGGEAGFDGPTPRRSFNPARRDWGALELAVRVAWLKVDPATFGDPGGGGTRYADPSKSAREATSLGVGAGWILRRSVRVSLIFDRTTFEGGAGTSSAVTDRATENLLLGRAQVSF